MAAPASSSAAYTALVVGSTGAVGRELIAELVASTKCGKVIALARREIPEEQWSTAFPRVDVDAAKLKLQVRAVDFDALSEKAIPPTEHVDAAFCCLGTTRKDAGSAEAFRKVDLEYVTRFGELAKAAGIPYMGLLTATNANKNSWFLYPQTKGEAEDNITKLAFPRTGIFRPGLLNRGELARSVEKIGLYFIPSITATAVAKGMVADFETEGSTPGVKAWSHNDLKQFE
ncbi:hypothetical protein P43SY_002479 [Pythium insidiosum]|uniref:Oxidoreductase htatip2-like protein n=1 Tax=Pythium insidiosum TaxID=114742 RepID=A0AAD5LWM3_PYTIN|nr:hypothetical protein P43SY_002479 [Pythium insidiosum]